MRLKHTLEIVSNNKLIADLFSTSKNKKKMKKKKNKLNFALNVFFVVFFIKKIN